MRIRAHRGALLLASLLVLACGDDPTPASPTSTGGQAAGGAGGTVDTGGLGGCAPGTLALGDGSCLPPGMGAEDCGEGFEHDVDACRPVLPDEKCPPGSMALPGEQACRPVAPCGSDTWGDIPTDSSTEHVDESYQGGNSNGSAAAPWTTVQQGVNAAAPGAIVAVAAGSYTEQVVVEKPLTLWGRCPELTTITSSGGVIVWVTENGNGSSIRGFELSGGELAINAFEADVTVEEVWIHGATVSGVQIVGLGNFEVAATLRGSLIEGNLDVGVLVNGAKLDLVDTVVRDVDVISSPTNGGCVWLQTDLATGTPAAGQVVHSLVEDCQNIGMAALGSTLSVTDSVVRRVRFNAGNINGIGIDGTADDTGPGEPSHVSVTGSYLEGIDGMGVSLYGGTLDVLRTVVRAIGPVGQLYQLTAAVVGSSQSDMTSAVVVEALVVEDIRGVGVVQLSGSLAAQSIVVRRLTAINAIGDARGIALRGAIGHPPATATIAASSITDVGAFGVSVEGEVTVTLDSLLIRDVAAAQDGAFGDGVELTAGVWLTPPSAELSRVRIDTPARAGLAAFGASATLTDCELSCAPLWLNAEPWQGLTSNIVDGGGNRCLCGGDVQVCKVSSTTLTPPLRPCPSRPTKPRDDSFKRAALRSFLGPDRELVAARVFEVEPATTRKVERLLQDPPPCFSNSRESHVEIIGVQDDQRTTRRYLWL